MTNGPHMDIQSPTEEQRKQFEYEPPQLDQTKARRTWRRKAQWEKIKTLKSEHLQAIQKLERHWHGAFGADVRWDEEIKVDEAYGDYEIAQFYHAGMLENAKKAVGSKKVWEALEYQIKGLLTPQDLGHHWGKIKKAERAKAWGEALIFVGLEELVCHWGLAIAKPPD